MEMAISLVIGIMVGVVIGLAFSRNHLSKIDDREAKLIKLLRRKYKS